MQTILQTILQTIFQTTYVNYIANYITKYIANYIANYITNYIAKYIACQERLELEEGRISIGGRFGSRLFNDAISTMEMYVYVESRLPDI